MNQQLITNHAEHCDFYVGNEHWDKSYEEQQRLWVEKFAELIVKECANRATWAQDTGAKDIGGEVLKHFGVEE
jgi:hypothetical protein